MVISANKLHILLDSREPSVTSAKQFFERNRFRDLDMVEHIRDQTFPERWHHYLHKCAEDDHILIAVHFLSAEQLEAATRHLQLAQVRPKQISMISYDCFSHLRAWCRQTGCTFLPNQLKRRKLTQSDKHTAAKNSSGINIRRYQPDELVRIWIQYRLMLAIISRTEVLGNVCSQLILGQPAQNDLQDEYKRAIRYFQLGEPDMAGGSYACEAGAQPNAIDRLRDRIQKIAVTDFNVLICGDSGTGKEVVAWALHELSERCDKTFLTLNCAGLPDELLESEMFGYLKGSHNMADRDHPGLLAQASNGTLFLDELPDMSPRIQAKLLRFVESGEYRPLGASDTRYANTRIVAAGQAKRLHQIRGDLLSRISQVRIETLPLNKLEALNRGTIFKIAYILLERYTWTNTYREKKKYELTPCDIKQFQQRLTGEFNAKIVNHSWHVSNIRELNNFLRQWIIFGDEEFDSLVDNAGGREHNRSQTVYDPDLEKYLKEPRTLTELKEIAQLKPLQHLKKAYIRHLFNIYRAIIDRKNARDELHIKPTQKEFAAIMNVSENTISLHLR